MDGYKPIATLGDIERKTEKATLVRVVTMKGERNIWFPVSQTKIERGFIWAKDWIIEVKGREVSSIITTDPRMIAEVA